MQGAGINSILPEQNGRHHLRWTPALIVFFLHLSFPSFTAALTHEELIQACRESHGSPAMRACTGGQRNAEQAAACRDKAAAAVRACYQERVAREAARKPPPSAPKIEQSAANPEVGVLNFIAPPRSIADITAILDQEKPDPQKITRMKSLADTQPPPNSSPKDLAQFYYNRANARQALSQNEDALADGLKALDLAKPQNDVRQTARIRQLVARQHQIAGRLQEAITVYRSIIKDGDQPGSRGTLIGSSRNIAQIFISMGDVTQADAFVRRVVSLVQEARNSPHPNWRTSYAVYGNSWEADADMARGLLFEARGQFRDAETAYRRSESFKRASIKDLPKYDYSLPAEQVTSASNQALLASARAIMKQGRLSEAEANARRALLEMLKLFGKYHPQIPSFVLGLSDILLEQGRLEETEKLILAALDIIQAIGISDEDQLTIGTRNQLASVLILQGKDSDALKIYDQIENGIAHWDAKRREFFLATASRIYTFYSGGRVKDGIKAAQALVKRQIQQFGEKHPETASARGALAVGLDLDGQSGDAIKEFRNAIPILMNSLKEGSEEDDASLVATRKQRLQLIIEKYIALLGKTHGADQAIEEGLPLADAIRGQSVQNALAASSARMLARDAETAELVRKEQDQGKQIAAQLGILNNSLSLPSTERDEKGIASLRASIEKLRGERDKLRQIITRRLPEYEQLLDPKPPTIQQIRTNLRPGEAVLSFYFGQTTSFVWSIPKTGSAAFVQIEMTTRRVEAIVTELREALEPNATTVSEIPAFNVDLAYELYQLILNPVEQSWKSADSLIVITNGALGLLPLPLLPTQRPVSVSAETLFSEYRRVPWLARTHAVTLVPSTSALLTLRRLPVAPPSREPLIAFGDPIFSEKEVKSGGASGISRSDNDKFSGRGAFSRRSAVQTRGVDSAALSQLPQLPDTADELRSIATALGLDLEKSLFLGKSANEQRVREVNLSNYKIVAFATHGLVPGDIDGLTQPALALTAPVVAEIDGDGLLTMDEILSLRLNADWVVLSACNTGAGISASAEAASGLGRAFFYAGTRAVLVTNWSVHSQSARALITDLFSRQAKDAKLTKSKAMQQAMLALVDGPGLVDEQGKTAFSYAHPLFWAPYSIIGDGG